MDCPIEVLISLICSRSARITSVPSIQFSSPVYVRWLVYISFTFRIDSCDSRTSNEFGCRAWLAKSELLSFIRAQVLAREMSSCGLHWTLKSFEPFEWNIEQKSLYEHSHAFRRIDWIFFNSHQFSDVHQCDCFVIALWPVDRRHHQVASLRALSFFEFHF